MAAYAIDRLQLAATDASAAACIAEIEFTRQPLLARLGHASACFTPPEEITAAFRGREGTEPPRDT